MLRPATPLSIMLFVAFVFLLLSVLSTPIVKGIPLATFQGVDYGVFGFCAASGCSNLKIGYNPKDSTDFSLPSNTRHSLSSLLVVHPVAAFLTLICLILAITAHLHSPSHSPRYLLALIILLLPTLLVTLLAFLVDILLFVPHLAWGGWIVLVSTILIVVCGVMTCAMRRTLVSRKARKKRIAENAEMSGENYYNRQNTGLRADSPPPLGRQPTVPMANGALEANKLPSFATFESSKEHWEDDRTPLNAREPTVPSVGTTTMSLSDDASDRCAQPRGGMNGVRGGLGGRNYNGPRDGFGNPLPSAPGFGAPPGPRRMPGGPGGPGEPGFGPGFRGRGRSGFPPRGNGRGGNFGRGGPGMGNGRDGIPLGAIGAGAAGMMAGEMGRGDRPSPPGYQQGRSGFSRDASPFGSGDPYARRQSPDPPSAPGYGARHASPDPRSAPPYGRPMLPDETAFGGRSPSPGPPAAAGFAYGNRGMSPGPQNQGYRTHSPPATLPLGESAMIGQAVEMDASTGSPSPQIERGGFRDGDAQVAGLVGLQSQSSVNPAPAEHYAPPRAAWTRLPPLETQQPTIPSLESAPISPMSPQHARGNSSDNYYEDVDPRFNTDHPPTIINESATALPPSLVPGAPAHPPLEPSGSYDSVREGPNSETSHFTSISQRGVNPAYRHDEGGAGGAYGAIGGGGHAAEYGVGGAPPRRLDGALDRHDGNADFAPATNHGGYEGPFGTGPAMF